MIKTIKLTKAMRHFRLVAASMAFLFSINLGLLENFISLNDLLRENRIYFFKENKALSVDQSKLSGAMDMQKILEHC